MNGFLLSCVQHISIFYWFGEYKDYYWRAENLRSKLIASKYVSNSTYRRCQLIIAAHNYHKFLVIFCSQTTKLFARIESSN